ncbi:MAG: deoxyribodipyrimidine photolyase [Planctomycetota bacterium]
MRIEPGPMQIPAIRLTDRNDRPLRPDGDFVVYWMNAARRTRSNFALQHAVDLCNRYGKPLVILEALRSGYQWASDRHHAFILQGMRANRDAARKSTARYYGYVEPKNGEGKGLLEALGRSAVAIVTDEWPCFFLPRMVERAAAKLDVRLQAVDSCGLLPLRAAPKAFSRAFDFRRFLQRELPDHLGEQPVLNPLARLKSKRQPNIPREILSRWPEAVSEPLLAGKSSALADLPIDHGISICEDEGGAVAGHRALSAFVSDRFARYADDRNHPDDCSASGLSPWLHYGHVGAHEVFEALTEHEDWDSSLIANRSDGKADGWWGRSPALDGFLDELITWRELGLNFGHHRPAELDQFQSLPSWSLQTMREHAGDERPAHFELETLAAAESSDPIWNAAQTELLTTGRMHNYLRMLWGKLVLAWKPSYEEAAADLIELNNRYALDGRDPNSYSGIFWVFGRFDRAWGPERPIYGKLRYMTSKSTRTKLRLKGYLERFGREARQGSLF